ncbi:MAG: M67 family metallopeptidase [Clostridia bacterium]|nr:M67 family metallopeptidase [Clostridia bacterium]
MIFMPYNIFVQIKSEGEKSYPNECCGIIYGNISKDGKKYIEKIEPVSNSFDENKRQYRFLITPETMLKAELYARKNKTDILGFYHSHPNCMAVPSEYDRQHALPVYSYIITSVVGKSAMDLTSWELFNNNNGSTHFCEEVINIE